MTGLIDGRAIKVLKFEIGKSYGGYTVESRTACFVTFEGCTRKKISIVDGVEQINVDPSFAIAAFVEPEAPSDDIEIYNPATPTELDIVAIYDNRNLKALPAPIAHEMATPIKVAEPTFQEVADKAITHGYTLINLASAFNPLPMYRLINTATGLMAHQFSMLCLADVVAWLDVKHQAMVNTVNTSFVAGQTYEAPNGNTYEVANRLGDSVELKNECGYIATRIVHRDSNGEYVRPELNSNQLYAADTPSWFYPVVTQPTWYSLDDIEETRAQIRRELEQDSRSLIEDRDADKAANFSMRGLV